MLTRQKQINLFNRINYRKLTVNFSKLIRVLGINYWGTSVIWLPLNIDLINN